VFSDRSCINVVKEIGIIWTKATGIQSGLQYLKQNIVKILQVFQETSLRFSLV
ncbi:MAG: hypothetical protein JWQ57_3773, partial [Mucilaginibacter sp.]|nr:hypothetical protein [Mucilaginibacter sp.]